MQMIKKITLVLLMAVSSQVKSGVNPLEDLIPLAKFAVTPAAYMASHQYLTRDIKDMELRATCDATAAILARSIKSAIENGMTEKTYQSFGSVIIPTLVHISVKYGMPALDWFFEITHVNKILPGQNNEIIKGQKLVLAYLTVAAAISKIVSKITSTKLDVTSSADTDAPAKSKTSNTGSQTEDVENKIAAERNNSVSTLAPKTGLGLEENLHV